VQYFSPGGIAGDITGAFSGLLHGGTETARAITALMTGNTTAFVNALAPMIGTSASGTLGQVMVALPKTLVTDAAKAAMGMVGGGSSSGGGAATPANVAAWMAAAVKAAGVPASWIPGLEIIARHESSDNTQAVNNWDSNAAAGNNSRGIMQVVPTTFAQYHVPGTSMNIFDPVANIAAAARYISADYGSVANVPGVIAVNQGRPYVGYDSGGTLPPGMTNAVNLTGKPEAVLTNPQWQVLQHLAENSARGALAPQAPPVSVNYYGPQEPSPEQKAIMMRELSLLVGGG
jgi:hypothetical protein